MEENIPFHPRRKTQEQFDKEVKILVGDEYIVIGSYINSQTKIEIKHAICDKVSKYRPQDFLAGARCAICPRQWGSTRAKTHAEFVREVEELSCNDYKVLGEYVNSSKKIKIKHKACGYVYDTRPNDFVSKGRGRCPVCFYSTNINTEIFALRVKRILGDEYTLIGEYVRASEKVKMYHSKCKNTFEMRPNDIVSSGTGCQRCSFDKRNELMRKTHEEFITEVYDAVKDEYDVLGRYITSHKHVEMRHNKCGHVWSVKPYHFTINESRCPICSNLQSRGVTKIDEWLTGRDVSFEREVTFEDCRNVNVLPFDFAVYEGDELYCLIEYDGAQHFEPVSHWGGEKAFYEIQFRDEIKNKYCTNKNISLLRIPYWDEDDIETILKTYFSSNRKENVTTKGRRKESDDAF